MAQQQKFSLFQKKDSIEAKWIWVKKLNEYE